MILIETLCLVLGEQSWSTCAQIPFNTVVAALCGAPQLDVTLSLEDRVGCVN